MPSVSPREILSEAKTPAFLFTDHANIRYLTGLALDEGYVLVIPRRTILFVSALSVDSAHKSARRDILVRDSSELPDILSKFRSCGFEADIVNVAQFKRWKKKFPKTTFIERGNVIREFRRKKDKEELAILLRARKITKEILRRVPSVLRAGITEERLARRLLLWSIELGADGLAFDPIVAFGTHTACPHHVPTSRVLQKGHLVQIDVGVKYRGYCADMSEVFFTAQPTKTQEQVYRTLCIAKKKATNAVRSGATTHELDAIARKVLAQAGIEQYFTHSLGHGVGLEIHEGVVLSQKREDVKLLKNEVITIEPGVYFPGKFGMRVEDMIFVQ